MPGGAAGDEDDLTVTINTTPLVDVMLVLLIIFLIAIPVAIRNVPVALPEERTAPTQTRPENITLSVDRQGDVFWGEARVETLDALIARLRGEALREPQPDILIRGDREARFEMIGRVLAACRQAGLANVGFITEPPGGGK